MQNIEKATSNFLKGAASLSTKHRVNVMCWWLVAAAAQCASSTALFLPELSEALQILHAGAAAVTLQVYKRINQGPTGQHQAY